MRGDLEQNPKNAPIVDEYSAPRIIPLEAFVTPEECTQLIQRVTQNEVFEAGRVSNPSGQNRSANRKVAIISTPTNLFFKGVHDRLGHPEVSLALRAAHRNSELLQ